MQRVLSLPFCAAAMHAAQGPHQVTASLTAVQSSSLKQWQRRLDYYVYETVGQLRIREMFDIVVDYPESRPAVQDMKECLAHTSLHRHFVACFKQAIQERLLHAGTLRTTI